MRAYGDGQGKGPLGDLLRLYDPRCQSEDLSDNVMKANTYGIRNLMRIMPNLPAWSQEQNGTRQDLYEMLNALLGQYQRYLGHVIKFIGGIQESYREDGDTLDFVEPVSRQRQLEALDFFDRELFTTPTWLLNDSVLNLITRPAFQDHVMKMQGNILSQLLSMNVFGDLAAGTSSYGPKKVLSPVDFLTVIHKDIWRELATGEGMDLYRRMLQKKYLSSMASILNSTNASTKCSDIITLARADLSILQKQINLALSTVVSQADREHLLDLSQRLKKLLSIDDN